MRKRFGLFGVGNVGLSIAQALSRIGKDIVGVCDVDKNKAVNGARILGCASLSAKELAAKADTLLVAVPDSRIRPLYLDIREHLSPDTLLVHFSGNVKSDIFKHPLAISAHPVKTFPHPRLEDNAFLGTIFVLEGTQRAIDIFKPVIEDLDARLIVIPPENKKIYHTMCVMASNLMLGFLDSINELGIEAGLNNEQVLEIILNLAQDTLRTAREVKSLTDALSGPILRGEVQTVEHNLGSLEKHPEQRELYRQLSLRVLEMARKRGLEGGKIKRIKKKLL